MKVCLNCHKQAQENDIYCRNCGCLIQKNAYYILINVFIVFLSIAIIAMIVLFIASYLVEK